MRVYTSKKLSVIEVNLFLFENRNIENDAYNSFGS